MSDNDEKILPVLRWLLIAFFGLLLVLALQLFLLVTRQMQPRPLFVSAIPN